MKQQNRRCVIWSFSSIYDTGQRLTVDADEEQRVPSTRCKGYPGELTASAESTWCRSTTPSDVMQAKRPHFARVVACHKLAQCWERDRQTGDAELRRAHPSKSAVSSPANDARADETIPQCSVSCLGTRIRSLGGLEATAWLACSSAGRRRSILLADAKHSTDNSANCSWAAVVAGAPEMPCSLTYVRRYEEAKK